MFYYWKIGIYYTYWKQDKLDGKTVCNLLKFEWIGSKTKRDSNELKVS